ncbi:epidermal growth factor receptor kinase substrate 8-like [Tigriopus californicus]|uniref:epidermal growth factor receptor kinase substrate 8-like n=1 Tax=Tigriopus californicus TaxID=6832 RepID=UPI0027DA764E|nr:epidermal growth factor receptor kinase substrate 8-like [Tigriopus californicus]
MMASRESRSSSNSDRISMNSNDGISHSPTYVLEHLATFSVSPENDLIYPADGMRRLLAMEKTNGIWTQKMLMRIENKLVNIMDHENKDIVEQFPLALVREPTAFTSTDPKELYNNILIFIVGHPPGESPIPAEMHIFQCVNVRARDVVEDIKSYHGGRGGALSRSGQEIAVGDLTPYGGNGTERSLRSAQVPLAAQLDPELRKGDLDGDETSSTSSDRYEKDVAILNRCFDDIEKFIARLQHAAAAFRELEKRRRSRKSKKKDMGDGMLSMRAKPPPEREFVDIFQKFKLSFNLLAKLKAHIHDPNAPELIHFLFTPLALIVDASHDSHYGPNLPAKVVAPLLTGSAVELLINCLTSKESELWHSLGEAWYIPAEEWKGYVPPYRPVFMDGWSPSHFVDESENLTNRNFHPEDEEDIDQIDSHSPMPGRRSHHHHHHHHQQHHPSEPLSADSDVEQQRGGPPYRYGRDSRLGSELSTNSPDPRSNGYEDPRTRFENQQRAFMQHLLKQGTKVVQVTYPRTANNDKELSVVRGEYLEVLDDTRKWWKTRNIHGQVAHVPHTIVAEAALDFGPGRHPGESRGARGRRSGGGGGEMRYF